MKTIEQLLSFRPQTAEVIHGKEPSLKDILYKYYVDADCTHEEATEYTVEYVHALEEFAGEVCFK